MSEIKNLSVEDIQNIENVIGYTFNHKTLLEQAFTRSSFVNENKGTVSNEVLEFYGDRAVDITVTKCLSNTFGAMNDEGRYVTHQHGESAEYVNEGFLSSLRSYIVRKKYLSERIDDLDLAKYLLLGKSDTKISTSIKEDLFEAICGAIAIDCNWNFGLLEPIVTNLLNLDKAIADHNTTPYNVSKFVDWYFNKYKEYPDYYYEYDDVFERYTCYISGHGLNYDGEGETKIEARNKAIENLYNYLFENGKIWEMFPEEVNKFFKPSWLNPTLDNSINILQEMEQKGLVKELKYEFNESGNDENGDPLWECTLHYRFDEIEHGYITCRYEKTKTDIKKRAAYSLVMSIFERYHYNIQSK